MIDIMRAITRLGRILVASVIVVTGMVRAEEPLARFGVISDVHILPSDKHRSDVMRDALKYLAPTNAPQQSGHQQTAALPVHTG